MKEKLSNREKRKKRAYDESNSELTFEEWKKLNYEYFGSDNVDWIPEDNPRNEDGDPEELDFNHD